MMVKAEVLTAQPLLLVSFHAELKDSFNELCGKGKSSVLLFKAEEQEDQKL